MDTKKTKWIEEKRRNWPEGSLERQLKLNYPGCSSVFEAVQREKTKKQDLTATQATKCSPDFVSIVKAIEEAIGSFDIDHLDPIVRKRLADMPIRTIEEAILWRDEWIRVMGEIHGAGGGVSSQSHPKDDELFSW